MAELKKRSDRATVSAKSKEKLKAFAHNSLQDFWTEVLNLAEVAIDGKGRYDAFRGKVLTQGNNAKRNIWKELDLYYTVEYVPNKETVLIPSRPDSNKDKE